jgi:hypothetical protein
MTVSRVVNFVLAVMFLVFAAVQINDPDPILWILIYGSMAVFAIMAIFEFYPRKILIAAIILFVLYSLVYLHCRTCLLCYTIPSIKTSFRLAPCSNVSSIFISSLICEGIKIIH